jgi:hypothetical protein
MDEWESHEEEDTMKGVRVLILSLIGTLLVAHASDGHAGGGGRPVYVVLSLPSVAHQARIVTEPANASLSALVPPEWLERDALERDAITGPRRDVTVHVRDEAGLERVGAKVYHNGRYVGLTGGEGTAEIEGVRVGDQLAALYQVYQRPSPKDRHHLDGDSDWAWRIYQTNVRVTDDGRPHLFAVTDLTHIQELTVRRDQPLVGFRVVACVEWDADSGYMADLRRGLERASALLYDVADGQFFWEVIEISDNRSHAADCDMRILTSNQEWPRGHIWGITMDESTHITLGRHFNGEDSNSGDWASNNGFRTMLHEFGHYGLGLWDEYLNGPGQESAYHVANLRTTSGNRCTSIMNDLYGATGLCSRDDPNYQDSTRAEHYTKTKGELTWETVLRRFADTASRARWMLQSPVERGGVVPGPEVIPVGDWMQVHITDHDTGVCPAFKIQAMYGETGEPMGEAEVQVESSSPSRPALDQGKADESGQILIYGAHPGDRIEVRKGTSSAMITVDCSETQVWRQEATAEPVP